MTLQSLLQLDQLTQVVDIGANPIDGDPPYKRMLQAGLCKVSGFEPQQEALQKLNESKSHLEQYFPYAVGDGTRQTLYQCAYSGWTSFYKPDPLALEVFPGFKANAHITKEIQVDTKPLDEMEEIPHFDFLKMDVQGSELSCLKSGIKKLQQCSFVQLEVSFVTLYEHQPGLGELDSFLREQGFVPHCFAALKQWPISPLVVNNNPTQPLNQLLEADMVYVRDFFKPDTISDQQFKHMAMVAHHCYQSFDLAARAVEILSRRGAIVQGALQKYISLLSA
ncbi:MAG: hypothetical protein RL111_502 [Pseudomonadota bacterium]|jgi:FkbM family methyltransferase